MGETPQEVLNRILFHLRSSQPEERLSALQELEGLNYSSEAILLVLEQMALKDPDETARSTAYRALESTPHRFIRKQTSHLSLRERQLILGELESWKLFDLIRPDEADVLKQRYNFDLTPAPVKKAEVSSIGTPTAPETPPAPPAPPAPRPTLTQTLLSETSIKIALYLGAFMVIAAAAILAALVEAARLPILLAVTLGFGVAAALTRDRLPQPSFVLFIVFSCLLPFDAAVLKDLLLLTDSLENLYWSVTYLILAGIWIFAAWFYISRFFSLATLVALDLAIIYFANAFHLKTEASLFGLSIVELLALTAVQWLMKWKDKKFALPLFGLATFQTLIVAFLLTSFSIIRVADSSSLSINDFWNGYWLVNVFSWLAISAFFVYANSLFPFPLFPWAVTFFLLPIPWSILQPFAPQPIVFIIFIGLSGGIYALASERIRESKSDQVRPYHYPLLIESYLPLCVAWLWGALKDVTYGFGVALGITIIFVILTIRKPRVLPWTTALIAALTTYFSFFALPFIQTFDILPEYLVAIAAFALLVPDLFLQADFTANRTLRWPPRILGALLFALTLFYVAYGDFHSAGERAIVLILFALLALGYALRHKKLALVYIFTALLPFAVLETLDQWNITQWLPALTALAVIYYLAGFFFRNFLRKPLRYSALFLGTFAMTIGLFDTETQGLGWYSLVIALLFAIEQYQYKNSWMEAGIFVFASLAWWMILDQFDVKELGYNWIGISAIWVALDLTIKLTYREPRHLKDIAAIGSIVIAAGTAVYLMWTGVDSPHVAAIGFDVFTVLFLVNALARRSPKLGYSATAAAPLAIFFTLRDLGQTRWLFPLITSAIFLYVIGYILRRRADKISPTHPLIGWDATLLNSGLGLGTLLSISAPAEGSGLEAAIPVALAATLWTAEAFARRNVWLGFPSNGLYLMAYFMILASLNVNEPQFYSVGAAALGLLMHYLLVRTGSRNGAFLTGMVSQLVLLSATYIQMFSTQRLVFFVVLFFQGLVVLVYGIVIRSRSLVITPIIFVVLGVMTVVYTALKGISTVLLIGCTGIVLLMLGILAVVLRERLTKIGERFNDWQA